MPRLVTAVTPRSLVNGCHESPSTPLPANGICPPIEIGVNSIYPLVFVVIEDWLLLMRDRVHEVQEVYMPGSKVDEDVFD